ncbi:hypothetical protein CKO35_16925 [Ectothiorhodospira shaposhnikovii]|uniref:hypothetical protein n=1 Tax=Ectothiorhodospira shaposhnikovii TaxID=1054 RepID=UPI00190493C5|nr:hypothetical protein [Ectothiorhodospira shaposhnikovii]MBK1674936.1 hypothetical protein [Ectothiorhodospira shaposhnikovii]
MSLSTGEVAVGIVAYFDVAILNADAKIQKPASPTTRNGPFLCVQIVGTKSTWTPLSWTPRTERVFIESAWREGGTKAWHSGTPYLNDGSTTYRGETAVFVAAAAVADTYNPETRQKVSAAGVAVIINEIQQRGGGLL